VPVRFTEDRGFIRIVGDVRDDAAQFRKPEHRRAEEMKKYGHFPSPLKHFECFF
jgi:hypothetical protein